MQILPRFIRCWVPLTIMDRSCAATILSEVEQAGNSGILGLLQKHLAIFNAGFSYWPG
jgi:hypothetical protein